MEKGLICQTRKFNKIFKRSLVSNCRTQDFLQKTNHRHGIEVLQTILSISKDLDDSRIWVSFSDETARRKPPELKIAQISINLPSFSKPLHDSSHTPTRVFGRRERAYPRCMTSLDK
jgi:hypothetical protein